MGKYSRQEIEEAFVVYQDKAARAARSGQWEEWSEQFTEDAVYIEHHYGTFEGRDAIRKWIEEIMSQPINRDMTAFPVNWYLIDEERGWVVCSILNKMEDPGDGSVHGCDNWTKLHYAGSGMWSLEEDMYNPNEFGQMVTGWMSAKKALGSSW
jgi:hypothetical protein